MDEGDTLRMLLDCDDGTIKVKKNGALLGTMVSRGGGRGRPVTAVAGVCWAVAGYHNDVNHTSIVRVAHVEPSRF